METPGVTKGVGKTADSQGTETATAAGLGRIRHSPQQRQIATATTASV
jgi:hypothetical protein